MSQYPAFISQNNIGTLHAVMSGIAKGIQNPALNLKREYSNMHHCMANLQICFLSSDWAPKKQQNYAVRQ